MLAAKSIHIRTAQIMALNKTYIRYPFIRARPGKSAYCFRHLRFQFIKNQMINNKRITISNKKIRS